MSSSVSAKFFPVLEPENFSAEKGDPTTILLGGDSLGRLIILGVDWTGFDTSGLMLTTVVVTTGTGSGNLAFGNADFRAAACKFSFSTLSLYCF